MPLPRAAHHPLVQTGNQCLGPTMDSIAQGAYAGLEGALQLPYESRLRARTSLAPQGVWRAGRGPAIFVSCTFPSIVVECMRCHRPRTCCYLAASGRYCQSDNRACGNLVATSLPTRGQVPIPCRLVAGTAEGSFLPGAVPAEPSTCTAGRPCWQATAVKIVAPFRHSKRSPSVRTQ